MQPLEDRTTRIDAGIVDIVVLTPVEAGAARRPTDRWRVLTLRRAPDTRCTGAWEIVHGRVDPGERPAAAARREVTEETGLTVQRLYNVTVNPFYLHTVDTIHMALVFAAIVEPAPIMLGPEHDASAWRSPRAAIDVLAWPREHQAVRYAMHLLRRGDAGAVEDVLRIP